MADATKDGRLEGSIVLVYGVDGLADFAPFMLDEAATPASVAAALRAAQPDRALALALGEAPPMRAAMKMRRTTARIR